MKDFKSVPVPKMMEEYCEKDSKGNPVPYVVLKDKEGKFHFKINDSMKSANCFTNDLCSICGQIMDGDNQWLLGGIASAFDPGGVYIDLPIHKECGTYALQVCPYLAIRNYTAKIDISRLQNLFKGELELHNPTVDPDRLPVFVFIRPMKIGYNSNFTVKALNGYHEVQYWRDGKQLFDKEEVKSYIVGTKWEKYLKVMFHET